MSDNGSSVDIDLGLAGQTAAGVAGDEAAPMIPGAQGRNGWSAALSRRPPPPTHLAGGIEPGGSIAHYATEMIVHTRPDRVRSYVSPGSRNLLGYEPHEILGLDFATFLHPDDRARVEREYLALQRDGGRKTSTYRLRHRNGRYV